MASRTDYGPLQERIFGVFTSAKGWTVFGAQRAILAATGAEVTSTTIDKWAKGELHCNVECIAALSRWLECGGLVIDHLIMDAFGVELPVVAPPVVSVDPGHEMVWQEMAAKDARIDALEERLAALESKERGQ